MNKVSYKLTNRDLNIFSVARSVSRLSDYVRVKVGCVVVYKKKFILSTASNSNKTHTTQSFYNRFRDFDTTIYPNKLHAEIHALILAKNIIHKTGINWSDVSVYVYREFSNGKPANSKPCNACYNFIKDLGIKNVYYINKDGLYVKEQINV